MFTLPFLQKKSPDSEKYIFILYFSGEKAYGFAFDEANPETHSALYQEHVDSFLKNAGPQIEKILANCERDLGEDIYLKKTVLVLNSHYTTDSGAIREDFLKQIKGLFKSIDLVNLGYVNFYEVVAYHFHKLEKYYFLEESVYDYTLYSLEKEMVKQTEKIAKTAGGEGLENVSKMVLPEVELVTYFYKKPPEGLKKAKHLIQEEEFIRYFTKVYFKDREKEQQTVAPIATVLPEPSVESKPEKEEVADPVVKVPTSLENLSLAPGFASTEEELAFKEDVPTAVQVESDKPKLNWQLPRFNFKFALPQLNMGWGIGLGVFGFVLIIIIYFIFFHQATILLSTKKENYSTNTQLTVKDGVNFVKSYQTKVSVKVQTSTTGEKVTGEKATGEVTIYNGLFEKKELSAGFRMKAENGTIFVVNNDVSVPAATTSANLNEGVVTRAYGKKTVGVTAESIGAEGNIDGGAKLTTSDISANDFYALANSDFSGGVKKTIAIFSNKDAASLEKKALSEAKNVLKNNFHRALGDKDVLFLETISTDSIKKNFSHEVGDEINKATLDYQGMVRAMYSPYSELRVKIQADKLHDKEFVADTFTISKIELKENDENGYVYTMVVRGQVQNYIDQLSLRRKIAGNLKSSAEKKLTEEKNITDFQIKTKPLPLPILPMNGEHLRFVFNQ